MIKDLLRDQSALPFHWEKVSGHYAPERLKGSSPWRRRGRRGQAGLRAGWRLERGSRAGPEVPGFGFQRKRSILIRTNLGRRRGTDALRPKGSWDEERVGLRADLARPTPEAEFGLTAQAAHLYEWVRALDESTLEFGLSPSLEQAVRDKQFPFSEGLQRNLLTVRLFCEEISERNS